MQLFLKKRISKVRKESNEKTENSYYGTPLFALYGDAADIILHQL